jgi:ribokinase
MSETQLTQWLAPIREDDWLVMQNETAHQVYAARMARAQGARVVYSAAPFEAKAGGRGFALCEYFMCQ